MADVTVEQVAETMYKLVEQDMGQKKYKPMDLTKKMVEHFGDDQVNKKMCKQAIRLLIDGGRLVYTYFGGTFLEVPHEEGAAKS